MKFGIREICNVVFRAKTKQTLGSRTFYKNEPVLYFDTLKTSNLEGAATTVYAQGGRGNPRLIAWEGERTLTFTMEDALLSPEGLSILTGAGLIAAKDANSGHGMFVHTTDTVEVLENNTIILNQDFACWTGGASGNVDEGQTIADYQHPNADIFIMVMDDEGNTIAEPCIPAAVEYAVKDGHPQTTITCYSHDGVLKKGTVVFVDYYVRRISKATQIEITADKFGGSYYIEADTLFRRQGDNYDMPATFVIPNGKVQSNFTFAMANTGDPSTFTFTVDAMPDYTKFDHTHKILAGILIVEDADEGGDDTSKRESCGNGVITPGGSSTFNQTVTSNTAGVTATIETNSPKECTIKVSGTDVEVDSPGSVDPNMWGAFTDNAAIMELPMPVTGAGTYRIKQTNPALEFYKGKDAFVKLEGTSYVKDKPYPLTDDSTLGYQFLVTAGNDVKIEFYKDSALVKTYTIDASDLTFKTRP